MDRPGPTPFLRGPTRKGATVRLLPSVMGMRKSSYRAGKLGGLVLLLPMLIGGVGVFVGIEGCTITTQDPALAPNLPSGVDYGTPNPRVDPYNVGPYGVDPYDVDPYGQ